MRTLACRPGYLPEQQEPSRLTLSGDCSFPASALDFSPPACTLPGPDSPYPILCCSRASSCSAR